MRFFINEQQLEVPDNISVREALETFDGALYVAVASGEGFVTDGTGQAIDLDARLSEGAILRARISARKQGGGSGGNG